VSRRRQIAFIALSAGLAVGLCIRLAGQTPPCEPAGPVHEVTDMTSRTVSIRTDPRRVLSLCTSATDTMVRLGAADRLAAIDEYSRIVPGCEDAAVIGKGSAISREHVVALGIDLAFLWWYQDDAAQTLEELSVPTVRIRCRRAADLPGMIRLVGRCVDRSAGADELAGKAEACLRSAATAPARVRPRVYLELYGPFKTVGGDSYANDLLEFAGGRNIAADLTGSVLLSSERLIQADPDVILFMNEFTTVAAIARRGGLNGLKAVRTRCLHSIDRYWLVPGAGLPAAVAKLRVILANPAAQKGPAHGIPQDHVQ